MHRFVVLIAATALLLVACASSPAEVSDGGEGSSAAPQGDGLVAIEQVPASPRESVPSGLDDPFTNEVPPPLIDPADLRAGGPPPDGIPAIDEPLFERAGQADWLSDSEPVLVLQMQGLTRAYPVQIMIWHEIVNDSYDNVPVAVTYCPLCNSAIAFDRRVAGRVLTFGTSGMLLNSDLVMYDRQTESLWPQLQMGAVVGELTGTELEPFVLATVPWAQFRDDNPEALVLSRDTGYQRDYGRNPYIGYDEEGTEPFLFDGDADPRLPAKTPVVGLFPEEQPTAVLVAALVEGGPVNLQGPQGPVVVWVGESVASALDEAEIAAGRSVPTVAVFASDTAGQSLSFVTRNGVIVDEQTGSQWDGAGRATGGPLQGTQLDPLPSVTTFWFAWAAFRPETDLVG